MYDTRDTHRAYTRNVDKVEVSSRCSGAKLAAEVRQVFNGQRGARCDDRVKGRQRAARALARDRQRACQCTPRSTKSSERERTKGTDLNRKHSGSAR